MKHQAISVRAFIGAKNFEKSRQFYTDLGFQESVIDARMSYFKITDTLGFYLQNAYVKDWIENLMIFLEVDDVHAYWQNIQNLGLTEKYEGVKLSEIRYNNWGKEFFLHDPSGVLWHFGKFNSIVE